MNLPPSLADLLHPERFSGVVSIVHLGEERLTFTSGLANREKATPITRHTRFPTASVSKMFTALCVARLVEDGRCNFEQPIREILPALEPPLDATVSLDSLLSHRSGFGDYIDDEAALPFTGLDVARLDCLEAFMPLVAHVPCHESGTFRYSSAGYLLLGRAIEILTGLPFPEAISNWVTQPAGLVSTGFSRLDAGLDDLAIGYLADGTPNLGHLPIVGGPDGGIVTNVRDLQVLFDRLRAGSLLSTPILEHLLRPVSVMNERSHYGHGFYITTVNAQTWYGHTGSDPGLSARVGFSMERPSSVIVLCNMDDAAFPVFREAIDWISATG